VIFYPDDAHQMLLHAFYQWFDNQLDWYGRAATGHCYLVDAFLSKHARNGGMHVCC